MSERYELCNPYQPLGAPSQAYRDGWDRIFGKKAVESHTCVHGNVCDHTPGWGCATCRTTPPGAPHPTPQGTSGGAVEAATPRLPLGPSESGLTAVSPPAEGVVKSNALLRALRGRP